MEDLELEPLPDGGTAVRWRYYYDPYPLLRPIRRLLDREFDHMLRLSLRQLDEHLASTRTEAASPAAA